jgi:AcrR family transcriptional regulator
MVALAVADDLLATGVEARIVEASLRCVARWGVAKTTVDDVAREAGVSRATVYRVFPGGKERIVGVLLRHELGRFFGQVGGHLDEATTLEDLLCAGMTEAIRFIRGHDALSYLLVHEPERILPWLALDRMGPVLTAAAAFAEPYLARFLPAARAAEGAELVARLVFSYALAPTSSVDPDDPVTVRRLVQGFVLPGLTA